MMKKFQIIIFVLSLVFAWGCSDFLNEESQDEVIVHTVKDYSELLLGAGYPEPYGYLYASLFVFDDDLEIDELELKDKDHFILTANFGCFTWQPDMWDRVAKMNESYIASYRRIMGCNAVLDGIDNAIGNQVDRERVKAEALAVRAYFYFQLVNLYGQPYNADKSALGVPLKLTAGIEENGIRRSTVEQVYNRIVEDLEEASALLEKHPKTRGDFRINYPSVNILLSRVYLFMERWQDAIAAADRAIKSGGSLTNYTQLSAETFYFTDYKLSEVEWIYGANDRSVGMNAMVPSRELLSKFQTDDRRRDLYFGKSMYTGSTVIKKQNHKEGLDMPDNVLRISEAYLNRAEAYAHEKDGRVAALADLNKLRRNRIVGYTDVEITDATTLLEEIRLERRKELCFEEQRWFDLRRYGMPSISHRFRAKKTDPLKVYTLKEKDPLYTLPIPNEAILQNRLLEQNLSRQEPIRQGL